LDQLILFPDGTRIAHALEDLERLILPSLDVCIPLSRLVELVPALVIRFPFPGYSYALSFPGFH
jgi:hypothetical protein